MEALKDNEQKTLIETLKKRFEKNTARHKDLDWQKIEEKLLNAPEKLWSLNQMEISEGEPDVIGQNTNTGEYIFVDCSAESPKGRRSICYDREALDARKLNKPQTSALDLASEMKVEILTEEEYRELQKLGKFDLKTSSWVKTPTHIRKLGGAIFCDRRYETVFMYHNGADSYYGARSFRGKLLV